MGAISNLARRSVLKGIAALPVFASAGTQSALNGAAVTAGGSFAGNALTQPAHFNPQEHPLWGVLQGTERKNMVADYHRAYNGGFDHDIGALRSVSRGYKIAMQERRDQSRLTAIEKIRKLVWNL